MSDHGQLGGRSNHNTNQPIVLVGNMGAGKTTVAKVLAQRLGRTFIDSDIEIERVAGMPIPQIFSQRGEPHFRELEANVIASILRAPKPIVLAVGGGSLNNEITRSLIRKTSTVVWLRAPHDVLVQRVEQTRSTRPMLQDNPNQQLKDLAEQRDPIYADTADLSLDTHDKEPQQVAAVIAEQLQQLHKGNK